MRNHDPYTYLLEALDEFNDIDDDKHRKNSLAQTREKVISLRQAYENSPCIVDYSDAHNRAAYLLVYYPHYIEPLFDTLVACLSDLDEDTFQVLNSEVLRVSFFGAGACPEVLGLLSFCEDYLPNVQTIKANLFDKYVHGWRIGQDITRYHLAPRYVPGTRLVFRPFEFDLTTPIWSSGLMEYAARRSQIFVIQNSLNEHVGSKYLLENMLWIYDHLPEGALFIIIDIAQRRVREVIYQLQNQILNQNLGRVVVSVPDEYHEIVSKIKTPKILSDELLIGADKLIPRKYTRFYNFVVVKP